MDRKQRNKRRQFKQFKHLSEKEKDEILNWILVKQRPIQDATIEFNLSLTTINRIFESRFQAKKERINNQIKDN